MQTIQNNLNDLNSLVLSGKAMEAFEKYYAENVVMRENENNPTVGKDANRKREMEFFSKITEFRNAEVKEISFSGNTSFVVWKYDYTHADWGVRNYTQVSVQKWENGKIIHEQFFYGN